MCTNKTKTYKGRKIVHHQAKKLNKRPKNKVMCTDVRKHIEQSKTDLTSNQQSTTKMTSRNSKKTCICKSSIVRMSPITTLNASRT